MNDQGILLLSTVMEILVVFSTALALLVLWIHSRRGRAESPKDGNPSQRRMRGMSDDNSKE